MKRLTAIFLSVLMLLSLTVSGLSAFAAVEEVKLIATDSEPISLKEVEATKYSPWFDLESSEIDYSFNVILPDGSVQELVREIVLTGSDVCTAKGITAGSSTDDIITAYGTEGLEITETYNYRYKTEDGRVLDICTDGSIVKEIKYYTEVQ